MTGEIIKYKSENTLFQKLGISRVHQTAIQAEQEEYINVLMNNIKDAYVEWQNALANFETAESSEMIDYFAYRIKASEIRYNYLLRKVKEAKAQ